MSNSQDTADNTPESPATTKRQTLLAQSDHWRMKVPADWLEKDDPYFCMESPDQRFECRIGDLSVQADDMRPTEELIQAVHDTDLKSMFRIPGSSYEIVRHDKTVAEGLHYWETELLDQTRFDRVLFRHLAKGQRVIRGSFHDHYCVDVGSSNAALVWMMDSLAFVDALAGD